MVDHQQPSLSGIEQDKESLMLGVLLKQKIKIGEHLLELLLEEDCKTLEGTAKLRHKIFKELSFLKRLSRNGNAKKEHLQCSNLTHFSALLAAIHTAPDCSSVNKVFQLNGRKIVIDIVSNNGLQWTKVIARNAKSLSQIYKGNASYGVRNVVDQAKEYVECARLHPCLFQTPKIAFHFAFGVGEMLAKRIESLGVAVLGDRLVHIEDTEDEDDEDAGEDDDGRKKEVKDIKECLQPFTSSPTNVLSHISKLNLDVSTMLAYVSSVTNGGAHLYDFKVHVLAQQAAWERQRPQKPILDAFFQGKSLYCCKTARDSFAEIVNTVGGPGERDRAQIFLDRITVLPDNAASLCSDLVNKGQQLSNVQCTESKSLSLGGKIRERSLVVFIFGDRIGAVTVTANDGFVRAAKQQGINFVVFVHESRALTEQKEIAKGRSSVFPIS